MTWHSSAGLFCIVTGGLVLAISACTDDRVVSLHYDFSRGDEGFHADVADYASGEELAFASDVRALPPGLGRSGTGLYLQSTNTSDDAFMFTDRRVGASDGLSPGARYIAGFTVTMASDAPAGCFGAGGAPADAVGLKVGAVDHPPVIAVETVGGTTRYRVNVDKDTEPQGGTDMTGAGDIANGGSSTECGAAPTFHTFSRTHTHPTPVTASGAGELWLMLGTDSGYEGVTRLFYQQIDVELTPAR